jgi:hypothetical protein
MLFYDPLERIVATLHPNHTYEKVVFDAWKQTTYNVNDTVAVTRSPAASRPAIRRPTPDISAYVAEYFKSQTNWETWHTQRFGKPFGDPGRDAAANAAVHADTPTTVWFDTPRPSVPHRGPQPLPAERRADRLEIRYARRARYRRQLACDARRKDRVVMRCRTRALGGFRPGKRKRFEIRVSDEQFAMLKRTAQVRGGVPSARTL